MEEAFENLKKTGKNDVDGLINWMKESKVIDQSKEAEDKARQLFSGSDEKDVGLSKFKEVISQVASDQKQNVDELMKLLGDSGGKVLDALKAGTNALKNMLSQ